MKVFPITRIFSAGAAFVLFSGCATTESGQQVNEAYQENRGVAVVGSRIKRDTKADERGNPSQAFSRKGMQATGARTAGEFLGRRY
jgi:hypothetical protein